MLDFKKVATCSLTYLPMQAVYRFTKTIGRSAENWNMLIVVFLFSVVSCLIVTPSPASAASVYDDSYHSIPSLILEHDNGCSNMPPTGNYTDYAKYILDENLWHPGDRNSSSYMYAARESYLAAINDDEYGSWGVSRETNYGGSGKQAISIYWSRNPNSYLQWSTLSVDAYNFSQIHISCSRYNYWGYKYNNYFGGIISHAGTITPVATKQSLIRPSQNLFFHSNNPNFNYNYPSGYEGELVVGNIDEDSDGLIRSLELTQGTSDNDADGDGDGLNDYIESDIYPSRANVFCGIPLCAYPDPLVKDVYVELDWMNDTAGSRLLKPSGAQLTYVQNMFDDKSVKLHIDTGQYGGGNALPLYVHDLRVEPTASIADFGDFKDGGDGITANFAANRHAIWKYMIYGYGYIRSGDPNYPSISGSSGLAEVSGDDIFVSGGIVEDSTGLVSLDRGVANTIAHEVGHTLCLSSTQIYQEQNAGCIYNGIDNDSYKPENYLSVMNYRYQLTDDDMGIVDYSDGTNGSGDHNDWGGVLAGMKDFSGTQTQLGSKRVFAKNKTMDPDKIVQETLPVKSDNLDSRQTNLPLLASVQPPASPTNTSLASDTVDMQVKRPSLQDNTALDWKAIGFVAFGGMGVLAWYILRRK